MMRQFVKNLKDKMLARVTSPMATKVHRAMMTRGSRERTQAAVEKANDQFRAQAAARKQERQKARPWQTDPMAEHKHTLHPSVTDRTALPGSGSAIPRPTSAVTSFEDGTKLRLYSDGSLRHPTIRRPDGVQVSSRRPAGLSGRQRRLQRRTLRRMVAHAVAVKNAAAATSSH